jgi:uncharacterized membrane protein
MARLSKPPVALASRVLNEVGFEDRLVGVKMTQRVGNIVYSIYSFEEAMEFLRVANLEDLLHTGSSSSVGYVDQKRLRRWVSEVFGDEELAKEIDKEIERSENYKDWTINIKSLMKQRLSQCKKILEDKTKHGPAPATESTTFFRDS